MVWSFAELTYDAWGMPESPNKLLNNDHGNFVFATFTGHIYDTTLDIYFAEARFYDAGNRTWLALDPAKVRLNWYQYCYSNPTTYWDPLGLKPESKQAKLNGSEILKKVSLGIESYFSGYIQGFSLQLKPDVSEALEQYEQGTLFTYIYGETKGIMSIGAIIILSGHYGTLESSALGFAAKTVSAEEAKLALIAALTVLTARSKLDTEGFVSSIISLIEREQDSKTDDNENDKAVDEPSAVTPNPNNDDDEGEKEPVSTNQGNEIDITPEENHTSTTTNPGTTGEKNSSVDILDENGSIKTRRWYDENGRAYRDVDMSDHGNPKQHPEWPHEHFWDWSTGGPRRN